MSLIITCKKCKKKMKAPDKLAGKRVRCKCGHAVSVPAMEPIVAPLDADLAVDSVTDPKPQPIDIGEIAALAEGEALARGQSCPECFAEIPEDGVLCTACGYDLRTGRRLGTQVETDTPPAAEGKPSKKKSRREKAVKAADRDAKEGGAMLGSLLKFGLIAACVGGLLAGAWWIKDAVFFDPQQQLEDAHSKVYAGMTIDQVVDALDRKPTYILAEQPKKRKKSGDKIANLMPAKLNYQDNFLKTAPREQIRYGFTFVYKFSERAELQVFFDGKGKVLSVEKIDPLAHLFNR